jgi:hypothetical protein
MRQKREGPGCGRRGRAPDAAKEGGSLMRQMGEGP